MRSSFKVSVRVLLTAVALLFSKGERSYAMARRASFQTETSTTKKSSGHALPTNQEIADAKAKSLVWVNTSTRVYHRSTSPLYGTTERGKFMSENDAKNAGYRIANESRAQRASHSKAAGK